MRKTEMVEAKKKDPAKVLLKNVRLSYPALYKAKAFGGKGDQGEPKFQGNFLMLKGDKQGEINIAKVEAAIAHVKKEKWPKGAPKLAAAKICLRDSEDMEEMSDGYEDCMYVSSSNGKKPRVLDADGLDVKEGDDGAPYAGCYVDAILRVWAQDNDYGKRINCSLEGVKFRDDGDAFGSKPVDADDFDEEDDDAPAPKRRAARDEEDDAPPKRRAARDEEDDAPPKRRAARDEEDDAPPKRRAARDEEDDAPPKRRAARDEEDDEPPRRRRSRDEDVA
jgi:Protein of unknown function (DUF2815)